LKKRLLITGSEGTVGKALCADLDGDYQLVATTRPGRSEDDLDVCDVADWQRFMTSVGDDLYALIHTVGAFELQSVDDCDPATFDRLILSNLNSAFYAYEACRERLRSSRGRLIFFGLAGVQTARPETNLAAYAAAKAGLSSLVTSIAAAEARHGLTCNLIAPGLLHNAQADEVARYQIPAGRSARTSELCAAVRFLLADESAQITATTLPLSGGWRL